MKLVAKVNKLNNADNALAVATLKIEDAFVIEGLMVRKGKNGELFVSFPARKLKEPDEKNRMYRDIAYPVTKELRNEISELVLAEYLKL